MNTRDALEWAGALIPAINTFVIIFGGLNLVWVTRAAVNQMLLLLTQMQGQINRNTETVAQIVARQEEIGKRVDRLDDVVNHRT